MSLSLEELLKLLGITEKDASVLRLVDGVVPSVDFVDLGANGLGESGFLVKKGRTMSLGSLKKDENGNWAFVAKDADPNAVKLSATNKQALSELVAAQEAHLANLKKAVEGAEEDETATDMPEEIKTLLAGMSKAFTEEPDPATAEPAAKGTEAKTDDPDPDLVPAVDDGTFQIGETVVTGELANIAKSMADAAGDKLKDETFAASFEQQVAGMAALQAQVDPNTAANQAVATVSKRMDSEMAELKAANAQMQETINAMAAGGIMGGMLVPDGTPQVAPTAKTRPDAPVAIPCNQDISNYIDGEAEKHNFAPKG